MLLCLAASVPSGSSVHAEFLGTGKMGTKVRYDCVGALHLGIIQTRANVTFLFQHEKERERKHFENWDEKNTFLY
jgi:hypothetical protein